MTPRMIDKLDDLVVLFLQKIEGGYVDGRQIGEIPGQLGIHELPAAILFLTEFKKLAASVPVKAYHDPAKGEQLTAAIQDALDDAIEREEELEDALAGEDMP